jgi:hypothetical protein
MVNFRTASHARLFALLCEAAGVAQLKVRAIQCRVACDDATKFNVELLAEDKTVTAAIEAVRDPNA